MIVRMNKAIVYIHGNGGNAAEAMHYTLLFPEYDVFGFDYQSQTPWEAQGEFTRYFEEVSRCYDEIEVIANSIGAYFLMNTPTLPDIRRAWLISPIVDMEALIRKMMVWADVTEEELLRRKRILTSFGETLSWEYLHYVRTHPLRWKVPSCILFGEKDHMTDYDVMSAFAVKSGAALNVMPDGEHWFHTTEQMAYLDSWIKNTRGVE